MFAIIETGGKQLKVTKGQEIFIEKINGNENDVIEFDKILMIDDHIGKPYLKKARVLGTVLKQGKAKKIIVFKYRPKKDSKTKYGHRQPYTKIQITDIVVNFVEKKEVVDEQKVTIKKVTKDKSTTKTTKPVKKTPVKKKVTNGSSKSSKTKK